MRRSVSRGSAEYKTKLARSPDSELLNQILSRFAVAIFRLDSLFLSRQNDLRERHVTSFLLVKIFSRLSRRKTRSSYLA